MHVYNYIIILRYCTNVLEINRVEKRRDMPFNFRATRRSHDGVIS